MIDANSRYAKCLVYKSATRPSVLGSRRRVPLQERPDDRFHTVIEGDRIDLIAHYYLGDAGLWWIIADYNGLFFPLALETGSVLRIPSNETVQMRLLD